MGEPAFPSLLQVQEVLCWADERLAESAEPALAAKILLAHVLRCTITDLFAHPERALTPNEWNTYRTLLTRRARHEPVAYLVGHRAFLDLDLLVDARVLIPRQETEALAERAIAIARRWARPRIADVGTGSGALAISLAAHVPQVRVFAVDSAAGALHVASANACRYGVSERIAFLAGDLLAPLCTPVEMIVANLPYVSEAEYAALPPESRLYEPREALVAGKDGLDAIRALLGTARAHLTDDGVILLEIGATQGPAVSKLAARVLPGAQIEMIQDYAHLDRVLHIEL